MSNPLLDALGYIGDSLDKPGRAIRGVLGGRPEEGLAAIPFSDAMGLTDPANRVSGRDLLQNLGLVGEKGPDDGFGLGDLGGMGVEMALDPLNYVGGSVIKRLIGMKGAAAEANAGREALLAKGAMPSEVAMATKAVDETGSPARMYHGANRAFDAYDLAKADPNGLYGPGIYTTDSPKVASGYASGHDGWKQAVRYQEEKVEAALQHGRNSSGQNVEEAQRELAEYLAEFPEPPPSNVRTQYLDARNPLDLERQYAHAEADAFAKLLPPANEPHLYPGQAPTGEQLYGMAHQALGDKASVNQALRNAGFDAITHIGGARTGTDQHRVWIALHPNQIYAPTIVGPHQPPPAISPLLAALGLGNENALARGFGNQGEL